MKTTEVVDILNSAENLKAQIAAKEERLAAVEAAIQRLSAIADLTSLSPGSDLQWRAPLTAKANAIQAEIDADRAALPAAQQRIYDTIALANSPLERKALTMYFCLRMSWKEIAKAINYSEAQVYRFRGHALEEIASLL